MGKLIFLIINCKNGRSRYRAYFEEREPGEWYGVRSEALPDLTRQERMLKNNNTPKFVSNLFNKKTSAGTADDEPGEINYKGNFYTGKLKCPSCGNTGYFKCGNCGKLTCWDEKTKRVKCAACGDVSTVEGYITDLDAGTDGGGKPRNGSDNSGRRDRGGKNNKSIN